MTEEEYFRKNHPDSCYGDKPLSPHWDFFQEGVEFGEQQSEKRIEELENKLEQTEKDLADYQFNYPTIKELQKENADLQKSYEELYNSMRMIKDQRNKLEKENESLENVKNIYIGDLLKAKEIIKTFLGFAEAFGYSPSMDKFISEAKQFISEVGK